MGGYRELQHPLAVNIASSRNPKKQLDRLKLILSQFKKARLEGSDVIIAWDANIDLWRDNNPEAKLKQRYANMTI